MRSILMGHAEMLFKQNKVMTMFQPF